MLHWCCIGVALITIGGYFYVFLLIRLTFVWIFDIPADRCLRIDLSNVTHGAAVASQRGGWQQDSPGSGSGWIWMDLDGTKKVSFSTHQALQALQILSGHNMVAVNAATWRPRIPKATCRHCKTLKTAPGVFSEAISAMEIHSRWEEAAV